MDSQFVDALGTNFIPTAQDIDEIKTFITGCLAEATELDLEITRVRGMLNRLLEKRRTLDREIIKPHRALLSLGRRLPHDVLREIFIHCIPLNRNAVMSAKEAPLLLGRVCSSWREIAYSTPRLWASLHIVVPDTAIVPHGSDPEEYLAHALHLFNLRVGAAREWLAKSGKCPISVSFAQLQPPYDIGKAQAGRIASKPMIDVLLHYLPRIRSIHLWASSSVLALFQNLPLKRLRLLESMNLDTSIDNIVTNTTVSNRWMTTELFKAPLLTSLCLNITVIGNATALPVAWDQITHLVLWSLGGITSVEARSILNRCHNLISCKVTIFHGTHEPVHSATTLSHLKWFSVLEGTGVSVYTLFDNLHLPALQHLEYRTGSAPHSYNSPFKTFLSRVGRQLERIVLDPEHFSPDVLSSLLRLTPTIKQLRITGHEYFLNIPKSRKEVNGTIGQNGQIKPFDDSVLRKFFTSASEPLCPSLQEFDCDANVGFSDHVLLTFIRGRISSTNERGLKRVRVAFNQHGHESARSGLSELKKKGFDVVVEYPLPEKIHKAFSPWDGVDRDDLTPRFSPKFASR